VIDWVPWSGEAFARAAREAKPVLLSITAAWCHACHEMDRTTYADPEVASLVRDRFVAVRVDTDRRPDINERYNLGGWPTTAFLTAAGDVITGSTFVGVDRMPGVLRRVSSAYDSALVTAAVVPDSDAGGDAPAIEALIESIFSTFDEEHGGFGAEPKFPHTAPLHLAMALFRESGDERLRQIVERSLDGMAEGGLWDARAGGFYRYATRRDWQLPHTEKLLETNAELLRAYAEAALVFGRDVDRDRCAALAAFMTGVLRAEPGGFRGSDADHMLYMDGNAKAAGALLGAATVLDDSPLGREALASFERVILLCYKPGAGLAHYSDGVARVRGLLADQIYTAAALLDAHDVSALEPYKMMAEELTRIALRDLWDADGRGFFDRAVHDGDVGLLRTQRKPFVANAEAASLLARLERTSGDPEFHAYAEGALRAAAVQLAGQGPLAAHYVIAARQLAAR
jgi:uncharacterized protein YyaL (SSP411 family)